MSDHIDVTPEEKPESQEHIDEMVKKVDGAEQVEDDTTLPSDGEGDEKLLAGKYKSEEDLQKGVLEALKAQNKDKSLEDIYKELESGLGSQKSESDDDNLEITKDDTSTEDDTSDTNKFDFTKYESELAEKGELTEDSYKELQEQGFPKEVVDGYISGIKAEAEKATQTIYEAAGGQENYQAMTEWAAKNLNEADIQAYNEMIAMGESQAKMAVQGLKAQYTEANGKPPQLLQGDTSSSVGQDVYDSVQELQADMSDDRYHTDPAYRAKVAKKLERSDIL